MKLIRFKGKQEHDAGVFYCPYVPLQMSSIHPKIRLDLHTEMDDHGKIKYAVNVLTYSSYVYREIFDWCCKTFGHHAMSKKPVHQWSRFGSYFYFDDEADRTAFILRWS